MDGRSYKTETICSPCGEHKNILKLCLLNSPSACKAVTFTTIWKVDDKLIIFLFFFQQKKINRYFMPTVSQQFVRNIKFLITKKKKKKKKKKRILNAEIFTILPSMLRSKGKNILLCLVIRRKTRKETCNES